VLCSNRIINFSETKVDHPATIIDCNLQIGVTMDGLFNLTLLLLCNFRMPSEENVEGVTDTGSLTVTSYGLETLMHLTYLIMGPIE